MQHNRVHTGEKPYECKTCKKTFRHSSSLNNHLSIHTGEKIYDCKICKKTFSQRSSLARHKSIHTGDKPYPCNKCGKAFSDITTLSDHNRIHTGEKPYSCNICRKSYSQRNQLSYHVKTSAHLKRMENKKTDVSFVDCAVTIKIDIVQGELNEEESVEDPKGERSKKQKYNCKEHSCQVCGKSFPT